MLHACALCGRKAPIGVEHAACLTIQTTRTLTFGAALCSFVLQSFVCVCVCVCVSECLFFFERRLASMTLFSVVA